MSRFELTIAHREGGKTKTLLKPRVIDGVKLSSVRKCSPSKLTFSIIDDGLSLQEGDQVGIKWDDKPMFTGFIFTLDYDSEGTVSVTAYDQMRYLKNTHVDKFKKVTATNVIRKLAKEYNLKCGELEDTSYIIPVIPAEEQTLFDFIYSALDKTLINQKKLYVLYDDCGKLTLKGLEAMKVEAFVLSDKIIGDYSYSSSIDSNTYNRIKVYRENKNTQGRDVAMVYDSKSTQQWGILTMYVEAKEGEDMVQKGNALGKLHDCPTRSLKINNVLGNSNVRAGSLIMVDMKVGGVKLQNWMLVESCTHTFKDNQHMMDLEITGGALNERMSKLIGTN